MYRNRYAHIKISCLCCLSAQKCPKFNEESSNDRPLGFWVAICAVIVSICAKFWLVRPKIRMNEHYAPGSSFWERPWESHNTSLGECLLLEALFKMECWGETEYSVYSAYWLWEHTQIELLNGLVSGMVQMRGTCRTIKITMKSFVDCLLTCCLYRSCDICVIWAKCVSRLSPEWCR